MKEVKEKEPAKLSANQNEKLPEPPATTEPLIDPKVDETDWSTLEFPKFVSEPDQPKKTRARKKADPKQLKLSTPKPTKKVINQKEYMHLMEIEEAYVQKLKLNDLNEVT